MAAVEMEPIGHVCGGRDVAEDDDWGASRASIVLDASFGPEALAGLGDFSHAEVIYLFDRVAADEVQYGSRHPRGRQDWPNVGIFAQRGKNRPNRIGVSFCRIVAVASTSVEVEGLDAIDGTPVLDIKPAMKGFLPRENLREPAWAEEIMREYW